MFLTYSEFLEYGGSADVTAAEFAYTEQLAESYINLMTHNRVRNEEPVRPAVKRCAFALTQLEIGYAAADRINSAGNGISSQSNDGISVTYGSYAETEKTRNKQRNGAIREYLFDEVKDGVPLLYAGVNHDVYPVR